MFGLSSGVTGGWGGAGGRGQSAPQRLLTRKFLLTYQEKRGKGKGVKIEMKRRKIVKGKVENWMCKSYKMREKTFFFFFFFFFTSHFSKPLKFDLGLPKWKFSTGKKHLVTPGKKIKEKWLCPFRKNFLLRPWDLELEFQRESKSPSYARWRTPHSLHSLTPTKRTLHYILSVLVIVKYQNQYYHRDSSKFWNDGFRISLVGNSKPCSTYLS